MNKTSIDWFAYRAKGDISQHTAALRGIYAPLGLPVSLHSKGRGYMGYQQSASVHVGDVEAGLIAWGGENQRGWIYTSLSGAGCAWVTDWDGAQDSVSKLREYDVRRVDIALDTFDPATGYRAMVEAYEQGGFNVAGAGRSPKARKIEPCSPYEGRTFYVGRRENDKFLRGYEKGLQQLAPIFSKLIDPCPPESAEFILSLPVERTTSKGQETYRMGDWFRHELELKPKSGALPEDVIDRRDQYFAGAYPYLGRILADVEPEALIIARERAPQLDLAATLEVIRQQYGKALYTALHAHHGDIGKVWSRIVGKEHSERLVRAGALMVEHL